MQFIDLKQQYHLCQHDVQERLARVFAHGQFILGPEVRELEEQLAAFVGVGHCLTTASGTDSLEIALRALEIGPGDEVITTPFTFISTGEAVALVGARPVFVDIEPATFNLDVDRLEAAITPRTKALLPVSLFGQMPDYDRINALAARYRLPVLEDGAQSFGAMRNGHRSCGVTLVGSTSFFPAKPLGCYGDGGALFTNDDALAHRMEALRNHGSLQRDHHQWVGMNGRFDTVQAAVLLAKLPHFEGELEARTRIGARYARLLPETTRPPQVAPGNTHVYAQYTLRLPNRSRVADRLREAGIPTGVYYSRCLHEQPAFADLGGRPGDFPVAETAAREVLSLPMHPFLSEPDQDRIVDTLRSSLQEP